MKKNLWPHCKLICFFSWFKFLNNSFFLFFYFFTFTFLTYIHFFIIIIIIFFCFTLPICSSLFCFISNANNFKIHVWLFSTSGLFESSNRFRQLSINSNETTVLIFNRKNRTQKEEKERKKERSQNCYNENSRGKLKLTIHTTNNNNKCAIFTKKSWTKKKKQSKWFYQLKWRKVKTTKADWIRKDKCENSQTYVCFSFFIFKKPTQQEVASRNFIF